MKTMNFCIKTLIVSMILSMLFTMDGYGQSKRYPKHKYIDYIQYRSDGFFIMIEDNGIELGCREGGAKQMASAIYDDYRNYKLVK